MSEFEREVSALLQCLSEEQQQAALELARLLAALGPGKDKKVEVNDAQQNL